MMGDKITQYIDTEICLPAIGQGALGLETRIGDEGTLEYIKAFNHHKTHIEVTAERALLKKLEGGCQLPIGAYGEAGEEEIKLTAMVASINGTRIIKETGVASLNNAEQLGLDIADRMLSKGADEIIQETLRNSNNPTAIKISK